MSQRKRENASSNQQCCLEGYRQNGRETHKAERENWTIVSDKPFKEAQNLSRLVSHWTDRLISLVSDWLFKRLQKLAPNACQVRKERGNMGKQWICLKTCSSAFTRIFRILIVVRFMSHLDIFCSLTSQFLDLCLAQAIG